MNLYALPPLVTSIVSFALGLFVFLNNRRSMLNISFSLICLSMTIWYFCLSRILLSNESLILYYAKLGLTGVIFIPALFLLLAKSYLKIKINKFLLWGSFLYGPVGLISLYTEKYFFSGILKYNWGFYPKGGVFEGLNILIFISALIYYHFSFITKCRELKRDSAKSEEYNKAKYFCSGFIFLSFAAIDYLPKYGIGLYPFGFVFFNIFTFIIAYAILKHHLLDINIVIKRGLVYSSLATIITIGYFLLIFLMERLSQGFIGYKSIPWTIFVVCLFIIIFQPLKNKIQAFVDKHFFKGTIDTISQEKDALMDELKHLDKMKAVGTIAAGVAHEIKNPLTTLKTFIDYLEEKHSDPEFRTKFKTLVKGEIEHIDTLSHQLLEFAKPKPLTLEEANIHIILDDALGFLDESLRQSNIQLTHIYDSAIPKIKVDPVQLKQVFFNLFLNSIDAMAQGGSLTVKTMLNQNYADIFIIDTGKGIAKEDLAHIFSPFYTKKEKGTGLGLAICESIINSHNGRISCTSTLHAGTTFIIKLPIGNGAIKI